MGYYVVPAGLKDLFSATVNVSAITVGFLGTIASILLSIQNKEIVQSLTRSGHFQRLLTFCLRSIQWWLFVAIVSSAGLLLDFQRLPEWHRPAIAAWVFVTTTAVLSYLRVLRAVVKILQSP
jgi:hypothetical protein